MTEELKIINSYVPYVISVVYLYKTHGDMNIQRTTKSVTKFVYFLLYRSTYVIIITIYKF